MQTCISVATEEDVAMPGYGCVAAILKINLMNFWRSYSLPNLDKC